jgi:hypothetical protein
LLSRIFGGVEQDSFGKMVGIAKTSISVIVKSSESINTLLPRNPFSLMVGITIDCIGFPFAGQRKSPLQAIAEKVMKRADVGCFNSTLNENEFVRKYIHRQSLSMKSGKCRCLRNIELNRPAAQEKTK